MRKAIGLISQYDEFLLINTDFGIFLFIHKNYRAILIKYLVKKNVFTNNRVVVGRDISDLER